MSPTPLTWNATDIASNGNSRTTDFRGKWVNWRDGNLGWKPISTDFVQDGLNLTASGSPWTISCPGNATKPILIVNRQSWDVHTKSAISDQPMEFELRHPGARPVSSVVIPGRHWQVVYPDAIQDGIDIAVGQWHGRGVRAEHVYVIRTMPSGDSVDVPIICELSASGKWLPIPDGVPVPINSGLSVMMPGAAKRGCSIRPPVAWYYDAAGEMVRKPITMSIRRLTSGRAELTKYVPRTLIAEALAARPGGELRVDTTSTFYPDPDTETTSVDGHVGRIAGSSVGDASQATIEAGAGTDAMDDYAGLNIFSHVTSITSGWYQWYRGIALFDTSILGASAIITAATFTGSYRNKSTTLGGSPIGQIYSVAPSSNTAIAASDYGTFGTTPYCDSGIALSAFSNGTHTWTLNATGQAAISLTGITKLGFRDSAYDVGSSTYTWASYKNNYMQIYSADQGGTSNDPALSVTYTVPGQPAVKRFGGVPFAHSLGRGVW